MFKQSNQRSANQNNKIQFHSYQSGKHLHVIVSDLGKVIEAGELSTLLESNLAFKWKTHIFFE